MTQASSATAVDGQKVFEGGASPGRALVFGLVWTSYMYRSRRVAATFIRDDATRAPLPPAPAALPSQTAS